MFLGVPLFMQWIKNRLWWNFE